MEIVRKYLTPDEITPPNIRIASPSETVEITPDGGATWFDVPDIDPRHSDALRLPPLAGDVRCDVAARMVAQWKDTLDGFVLTTDAANAVQFLLTLIVALTGAVGVLVWVVWSIVESLILIGRENIVSAFTPEVWDGILCIIDCNIGENGQMSAEQNAEIMSQIAAEYPGTVYNTLVQLNYWYGEVLLSNAGVERSETGDCSECACEPWCYFWDAAALVAGNDWNRSVDLSYSQVFVASPVPAPDIFYVRMTYDWNGVDGGGSSGAAIRINGTNIALQAPLAGGTGVLEYDGTSINAETWLFGGNTDTPGGGGTIQITSLEVRGTAPMPAYVDGEVCGG